MKAHAIINRFMADGDPTPGVDVTGVSQLGYVHHWHLHQDGEPVEARIEHPSRHGKGRYPVNFDAMVRRVRHVADRVSGYDDDAQDLGVPICLEMEIGASVYDLQDTVLDLQSVRHVGAVAGAIGGSVARVDCVYGQGWRTEGELVKDLASYTLYGSPDRLAVPIYGGWSQDWGSERKQPIERARRLAEAITHKDVRLALFISPYDDARKGVMDIKEWRLVCQATRTTCEALDCDVVVWFDSGRGGDEMPQYAGEAEPYMAVFRAVFAGFEGVVR